MPARRPHERDPGGVESLPQRLNLTDPKLQVALVEHLLQAAGNGLEVPASETAIGREALDQDEHVLELLEQALVPHGDETADVGQAVLLRAHRAAVAGVEHVGRDLADAAMRLPGLPLLDEPRVLGKPTGVEEERNSVAPTDLGHGADVGQAHRLAAARVVGHGQHRHRHRFPAVGGQKAVQAVEVDVALERVQHVGVTPLTDHQVHRLSTVHLDVCPGGVEVVVRRDLLARRDEGAEEQVLGHAALVRGDDEGKAGEVLHHAAKMVKVTSPGVGLVTQHQAGPLVIGHGRGAGVGQEVDEDVLRRNGEDVVAGLLETPSPGVPIRQADRLHHLDPPWLCSVTHRPNLLNNTGAPDCTGTAARQKAPGKAWARRPGSR